MGIANDEGNAGKGRKFFRSALGVAAGDENFGGWVLRMDFANGIASLNVSGGSDRAGVNDDEFRIKGGRGGRTAALAKLALDGGAVGLRGPAAELFDVKGGHGSE